MASFELTGKLIEKYDIQEISGSFRKREFVVEVANPTNSDWNDMIKFQMTQDKVTLIDAFKIGDEVKVSFNIKGRKWEKEGKVNYFSNLEAWRLESTGAGSAPQVANTVKAEADIVTGNAAEDDLPF